MNPTLTDLIDKGVLDIIGLAVLLIVYGLKMVLNKAETYITSKTNESNRNLLTMIANDAVLFVEQQWKDLDGAGKFSQAVQHAVQVLNAHGVSLTAQDVQAAIQAAYSAAKNASLIK